ncbi:MAG: hypothetical protein BWY79_01743 [Actinobacteria bacterium ADurb.Bin444]|nr:MAG: hypothetical protein BWY79_01743 [Actinobacteria bacterium ADurb.Bin444]
MVSRGSPTTKAGSISRLKPRPLQVSQAPCGELKEKMRGAISGNETPCSGQARFSEKSSVVRAACPDTPEIPSPSAVARSLVARSG